MLCGFTIAMFKHTVASYLFAKLSTQTTNASAVSELDVPRLNLDQVLLYNAMNAMTMAQPLR